jgi:GT2 family glycosyltransferase
MGALLKERPSAQVVVVVLNWNGRRYLEPCLRSVLAQEFQDVVVVLVDNGSTDGSVEYVRERFPHVHLIVNDENRGFAAANNQAIRASDSEFVVTLNNDAEVEPGWLSALVEAAEADPRIGMCASKMLFARRRDVVEAMGIAVDRVGIAWNRGGGQIGGDDPAIPEPVFGPCAGAALYRRSMLDDVGLFDEDFFAYLEDVDLAWRAQWADWRCVYVPQAVVLHLHSATAKERSRFKTRLLGRNKAWLLCKNHPRPLLYAPLILAYDLLALGYAVSIGCGLGALLGRIEALGGIPRALAARRRTVRRVSAGEMLARLHRVEPPHVVARRYAHLAGEVG